MQISLVEIWQNMGLPVRCVVMLLTLQAVACIAVVIDRVVLLARASARTRAFAAGIESEMERGAYKAVLEHAALYKSNHLATFLEVGLRSFLKRHAAGDSPVRAAEIARRALERVGDSISRDLNRGMNILASTGSTAPFVGLLGTVLGIINAFKMIAVTGSGGLGSIGSAISEALFVTAYGLIVAIPSVLTFNFLSSRIATYEAGLVNAGSELVDRLELSDDHARTKSGEVAPLRTQEPFPERATGSPGALPRRAP
jgi:biopolymer transport protein ExbB/TolQ